jgi:hypothetical protein
MTSYAPGKSEQEVEQYNALHEAIMQQSVQDNLDRLNALPPTPVNLMKEIKVVESLLLALLRRR